MNVRALPSVLVLSIATLAAMMPRAAAQGNSELVGAWTLNRELTPIPDQRERDRDRAPRPPGGGGGRGGPPMGGGFGGGFPGGGMGGGRGPSESDMRKLEAVRSRLQDIPELLVISVDGTSVQIVDGHGRTANLRADGKSQDRVTGDGEFKSKTRFDGPRLIVEEDFGGPKTITTFEPLQSSEGRRIQVTVRAEGMKMPGPPGRGEPDTQRPPSMVRVYDLDPSSKPQQ